MSNLVLYLYPGKSLFGSGFETDDEVAEEDTGFELSFFEEVSSFEEASAFELSSFEEASALEDSSFEEVSAFELSSELSVSETELVCVWVAWEEL